MELDDLNHENYYFKALICVSLDNPLKAEKILKRAIFLNKSFVEAYYHLGLLLLRRGKKQQGIKALENAMKAAG